MAAVEIDPTGGLNGVPEIAMIPANSLVDGDGRSAAVWVPDGRGGAQRRAVTVEYFDGARVAISAGLDGASEVVAEGAAYLSTSSRIAVTARESD